MERKIFLHQVGGGFHHPPTVFRSVAGAMRQWAIAVKSSAEYRTPWGGSAFSIGDRYGVPLEGCRYSADGSHLRWCEEMFKEYGGSRLRRVLRLARMMQRAYELASPCTSKWGHEFSKWPTE